ncbi:MAG: porin [Rubrivivax sp.]|jgi:predicted porin
MKKSLLALAALTAFAGAASAQSSVTLFGIVDAGFARVSAGGKSNTGMTNSGLNSSRLGFRGVEDLGGGLRAAFWLEGQLNNDDGNATGLNFQRRSTVSLLGGFGEIRLGRDFSPHFMNLTVYDPFGTNGIGTVLSAGMISSAGAAAGGASSLTTASQGVVRSNNGFHYFTPAMGGFVGHVHWASGEQLSNAANKGQGDIFGFRVGYAAGPISAHYAYGNLKGASGASNVKYNNIGASYNLGFVRPMFQWATEKAGTGAKVRAYLFGAVAPMGKGELRASYSDYDVTGTGVSNNDWNKMAIGYGYNLSKRTQLYGTYARVSNDGAQTRAVANNGLSAGTASPGGSSTGYELGVRHSF